MTEQTKLQPDQIPAELSEELLDQASGGLTGGDDDLDDLEVERLRARRR